jgi:hypothetical protein
MLDIVKQLFENNVISEEIKSEIESSWNSKIQETRDQMTAELREEFAQKYEHDKSALVEALDTMVGDRLQVELAELAEDRNQLIEAKAKYAKKMKGDSEKMKEFVLRQLATELKELHEDRKSVAENVSKLESFIVNALAKEISEFHTDKKDLVDTKVKLVRENKEKFEAVKAEFISKASKLVENVVKSKLTAEMTQLKEDIEAARKNDFGRRIFESFASEYASSHLNEKSETAKLLKLVKQKEAQLEEAVKAVQEKEQILESKDREIRVVKGVAQRDKIMSELLNPLTGDKKTVMSQLLESVQTEKLDMAFDKYLPAVMAGDAPKKKALTEGKEVTGNKEALSISGGEKTADILHIRKLAGLKV